MAVKGGVVGLQVQHSFEVALSPGVQAAGAGVEKPRMLISIGCVRSTACSLQCATDAGWTITTFHDVPPLTDVLSLIRRYLKGAPGLGCGPMRRLPHIT